MNALEKALKYHVYKSVFCEFPNVSAYHFRMACMYAEALGVIE